MKKRRSSRAQISVRSSPWRNKQQVSLDGSSSAEDRFQKQWRIEQPLEVRAGIFELGILSRMRIQRLDLATDFSGQFANFLIMLMLHCSSNPFDDKSAEESWIQAEQSNQERHRQETLRVRWLEETNPSRRPLHKCFVTISTLTGISALNMGLGQLIGILVQTTSPIQYILRIYVIALCCLVVLVEREWTLFARESKILHNWVTRGLCYGFIGLLGLEQNDVARHQGGKQNERWVNFNAIERYVSAVAWIMVACGVFYFAMGICCLQLVYNRLRRDYQERCHRAPEIKRAANTYGLGSETV